MRRNPLEELERAKTRREHHAALRRAPNLRGIRTCGGHTVYEGLSGCVPVDNHNGDVKRGTHFSIVRLSIAAGLFLFVAALGLAALLPAVA